MMGNLTIETEAYVKLMLHAAKYPDNAVNGILIGDNSGIANSNKIDHLRIVNCVPLFHQCLYTTPMAEVALAQIDAVTSQMNMVIAGYYAGCENINDNIIDVCPAIRIADKIAEYFPHAVVVMIDNQRFTERMEAPAIKVYEHIEGKWKLRDDSHSVIDDIDAPATVAHLINRGVHKELVDFDNHLDDITQDWSNTNIHNLLKTMKNSDE